MIEGVRMKFDHVSIAVRSIDRTYEFFKRYFPVEIRNAKSRDDQVSGSFNWQDFMFGGFAIETIEDLPGQPGFVTKFIERRGEGMHHLSVKVDKLAPLVEALKRDGVRVVDEQTFPDDGAATAFVSPRSAFGILIQFWELPDFDGPKHGAQDPSAYFDHFAIAVKDINRAMDFFSRYFPAQVIKAPYLSDSQGNFLLSHMNVAGRKIEFLQSPGPGTRNDFVAKFIERHGEGLHHFSVGVAGFESILAKLKADGVRVVDEKINWRGQREFFISPSSAFGALVQIWDGIIKE